MEPDVQLPDEILDTPNLTMHCTTRCCVYVYVQEQCKHSRVEGSIVQETPDKDVCVLVQKIFRLGRMRNFTHVYPSSTCRQTAPLNASVCFLSLITMA